MRFACISVTLAVLVTRCCIRNGEIEDAFSLPVQHKNFPVIVEIGRLYIERGLFRSCPLRIIEADLCKRDPFDALNHEDKVGHRGIQSCRNIGVWNYVVPILRIVSDSELIILQYKVENIFRLRFDIILACRHHMKWKQCKEGNGEGRKVGRDILHGIPLTVGDGCSGYRQHRGYSCLCYIHPSCSSSMTYRASPAAIVRITPPLDVNLPTRPCQPPRPSKNAAFPTVISVTASS